MMLEEIIRNFKSKAVVLSIIGMFLLTAVSFTVQTKKENNSLNLKITESQVVAAVYGDWKVMEYLGSSVEYHGAEATTKEEKCENERIIKKVKEKYLNKELHIDSEKLTTFSPSTELGYHVLTFDDLFMIFRQPPKLWDGIAPPFLCISLGLKGYDDSFDLIVDTKGKTALVVKGEFFHLVKISTD